MKIGYARVSTDEQNLVRASSRRINSTLRRNSSPRSQREVAKALGVAVSTLREGLQSRQRQRVAWWGENGHHNLVRDILLPRTLQGAILASNSPGIRGMSADIPKIRRMPGRKEKPAQHMGGVIMTSFGDYLLSLRRMRLSTASLVGAVLGAIAAGRGHYPLKRHQSSWRRSMLQSRQLAPPAGRSPQPMWPTFSVGAPAHQLASNRRV